MERTTKASQLPVRTRRTIDGGGGQSTIARSVLCPARGRAVALAVCGSCSHRESIADGVVTCHPEAKLPAMRWTPLLRRILPSAGDRVAIADVMSRDVWCVTRDVSIEALRTMFLDRGTSAAPVVDDEGFPIGMVSKTDLVREPAAYGTVADIMMSIAFTLDEREPLSRAAAVMDTERVHHLPVVDAGGRVVGMLSSLDFVSWVARQAAFADEA